MWLLTLAACAPDPVAAWAYDPIWLEPLSDELSHGFQTWQLYGEAWAENQRERHYVCAVLVELEGTREPCDADPSCTDGWQIVAAPLETDCVDASTLDDPLFVSLVRLGLGAEANDDEVAWPGLTSVGWADYGGGWEIHGDAYPEKLDLDGSVAGRAWDGVEPFLFVPSQAFPYP